MVHNAPIKPELSAMSNIAKTVPVSAFLECIEKPPEGGFVYFQTNVYLVG